MSLGSIWSVLWFRLQKSYPTLWLKLFDDYEVIYGGEKNLIKKIHYKPQLPVLDGKKLRQACRQMPCFYQQNTFLNFRILEDAKLGVWDIICMASSLSVDGETKDCCSPYI